MRIQGCCFMLLLALLPLAHAQTSDDFRARYGKPIQEVFVVGQNILLAAHYAVGGGEVCAINIFPAGPNTSRTDATHPMPTDAVTALIDTVAPVKERGTLLNEVVNPGGQVKGTKAEYSNVTIIRGQFTTSPTATDRDIDALITFTRRCPKQQR